MNYYLMNEIGEIKEATFDGDIFGGIMSGVKFVAHTDSNHQLKVRVHSDYRKQFVSFNEEYWLNELTYTLTTEEVTLQDENGNEAWVETDE